jgi:hypothetical protein
VSYLDSARLGIVNPRKLTAEALRALRETEEREEREERT